MLIPTQAKHNNYSLCEPVVNHDHERIKTSESQKTCDKVDRNLFKGVSGMERGRWEGQNRWVSVDLVGLTSGTASEKSADKGIKPQPPIAIGQHGLYTKDSAMVPSGWLVDEVGKVWLGQLGNILEVEMAIFK